MMRAEIIEDIYPLSPLQQGILFHSLYAPTSGEYFRQLVFTLRGRLNVSAFERAWARVISRHTALRAAFVWEDLEEPVQVVRSGVDLKLKRLDWRDLPSDERKARIDKFLEEDRRLGFDFTEPPLMRVALIGAREQTYDCVWSYHHLILDGWSKSLLLQEVLSWYQAIRQSRALDAEQPRPFRDYIAWLKRQDVKEAESFWRRTLRGVTGPTPIGVGHPRGHAPASEAEYDERRASLPPGALTRLEALARRQQITLNTIVQGAWALLLSRYSGERSVVFGVAVSGRPPELDGIETMVGMFINTLPARVEAPDEEPLSAWLARLHAQQSEMRQYEYSPLLQTQGWSEAPRGQSLFESILVFENFPVEEGPEKVDSELEITGARVIGRTNYPLSLFVTPGRGLEMWLIYNRARFDHETVDRMLGHLSTLLRAMGEDAPRALGELPLLTDGERHALTFEHNLTSAGPWRARTMMEAFEAQVERTPDAVAVIYEEGHLTYDELNRRANRLARRLRRLGAGPEALVGVCVERKAEAVVALLSVLKSGAAYVPLDPGFPPDRLAFMFEDAGLTALIAEREMASRLPQLDSVAVRPAVVWLDVVWDDLAQISARNLRPLTGDENLAYLIYTSGSTGRPKGVCIPHRALNNFLNAMLDRPSIDASDRLLAVTTFSFDIAALELYLPLVAGACVALVDRAVASDGDELARRLVETGATVMQATPATWRQLLAAGWRGARKLKILCGGEGLPRDLAVELRACCASLWNMYGPTETTIWSAVDEISADPEQPLAPIGRPIANTQLYVADAGMRLAPLGVAGELLIGGAGLARGYAGRPELTADRFIPDPFSREHGARLYRTGDLTISLPGGVTEFLGRIDHQVKVRGYRIELGEIEAALARHVSVGACAVVAREEPDGEKALVAYLTPGEGPPAPSAALREHLRGWLPEHMLPAIFVTLDELPMTPNGKIDRKALPDAAWERGRGGEGRYAAPRTSVEELLASVWADALRLERVGVNDNFFDLGGHSLIATRIMSRARNLFGVEAPLRALFESPTVAGLAAKIEQKLRRERALDEGPRPSGSRAARAPLSFAQQRLWFLDQLEPGAAYNVPAAFKLEGALNFAALEQSLGEIVRRHESLRTVFTNFDGQPFQIIAPARAARVAIVDLSDLSPTRRESEARLLAEAEARRQFDLERGPVLRVTLLKVGADEYNLLLTMHHIVSDAWSMGLLVKEVAGLYEAFARGDRSPLAELAVQYADYAAWQRGRLSGENLEELLGYWRERLAGAPPALELPADRPRPPALSHRGARAYARMRPELLKALRALSRREGVTTFMSTLAVFQTLLARYTGQPDILTGTPIANRTRVEAEEIIGFFDNTLVLRTDFSGDPSFRNLLSRVREVTLGAYAYQDLPFERLVEDLQPERGLNYTPLFQVMLVLENDENGAGELARFHNLSVSQLHLERAEAKFDLLLYVRDTEESPLVYAEYSTDLFDAETVRRLLGHFLALLASFVADPEQRVSEAPLLTEPERRQLVEEWNETRVDYSSETLVQLCEAQIERAPDAVAVVAEESQLSYAELNRRANRLAHALRTRGAAAETLVGVCMERAPEMCVALLGALKAGGAYVPLDPAYPRERLAFMLADARARVLLTQERLHDRLSDHGAEIICVDGDERDLAHERADNPACEVPEQSLLYVIYTSGSTGRPKGVSMTRGCLTNLLRWQVERWGDRAAARTLQFTSLSFDVSFQEIVSTWMTGGALILVTEDTRRDPAALWRLILDERIERLFLPYVALKHLAQAANGFGAQVVAGEATSALREIITAGEALHVDGTLADFFGAPESRSLDNQYGPSETHVVTAHRLAGPPGAWPGAPPIGRPVANSRIYLLDAKLNPAPVIAPGELFVGGVSLGRGYLSRPELTAERFIPDPYAAEPGARLYRTGDLARYLRDGEIEFLGRNDFQVKVRGFRVELGEIESALAAHPSVREAVVAAREDERGGKRLVAYLVMRPGSTLSPNELRASLRERLPEYMTPSVFVALDHLPLTPTGKVDRRRLPAPSASQSGIEDETDAPRNPVEEVLTNLWAEALGRERVGRGENFFDAGGHSLLATQLVSRLRAAFGLETPLRDLFERPTPAALAELIAERLRGDAARPRVAPIKASARGGELELSFAQQRLWLIDQVAPGGSQYNIATVLRLQGGLNLPTLEQTLSEIIRRHEALRTTFSSVESRPAQVIHPAAPASIACADLGDLAEGRRHDIALRLAAREAERPFDLERGPVLRVTLLKVGADEYNLLLTMHHIVSDAWSMGLLVKEVAGLYEAFARGDRSPLAELAVQYADYAAWQRGRLSGENLEELLGYWRERLAGAPPALELPADRPRPARPSFRGAKHAFTIPAELLREIQRLSRLHGATTFMTLLAGFKTLLARYARATDIIVGADIANRDYAEIENLIGFFVNMLVLRTDLSGDPPFTELLRRVRETALGAYARQDLPFDRLVGETQPGRNLNHTPLFQVVFNYINTPMRPFELPGLSINQLMLSREVARFDLSIFMVDSGGEFGGYWVYNTDMFNGGTIARLSDEYVALLGDVVRRPEARLSSYALISQEEQERLAAAEAAERERGLKKLKRGARKAVNLSRVAAVAVSRADEGGAFPLVLEPAAMEIDPVLWAEAHAASLDESLRRSGAILFRGFDLDTPQKFRRFINALTPTLMDYSEPSTPRTRVERKIYTSTEYPAEHPIALHNEMSYSLTWPMRIWFYCAQPPEAGGETPIADSRRVYQLISPALRERFAARGVMYVRNYGGGLGLPWQEVFQTTDRALVEAFCAGAGIQVEWRGGDRLRTRQVRQAIARHPRTGEMVWFNQAHVHHISCLAPSLREALFAAADSDEFPLDINACYGDGSSIEWDALEEIRSAYGKTERSFPWRRGDALILDNMLAAHGRAPFSGARRILVAMAEPFGVDYQPIT